MKIAYFDCQFGAAGDMLVGALLAAGLPAEPWLNELRKIALPQGSFAVSISPTNRCTIACTKVFVDCRHEHAERHLSEIVEIIDSSEINPGAKELSKRIFGRLADAESKVHGIPTEAVHFHEVGALDAIVDIIGFAIGYQILGIETSHASALPLGSGVVKTEHGLLPVPGPAVLNLLATAGVPTCQSEIDYECLTPTGAAILTSVVTAWGKFPSMTSIYSTGYGAGHKDPPGWPNAVRVTLGESLATTTAIPSSPRFASEQIAIVEANLDDSPPQTIAYAVERIFEAGALDVTVTPVLMKKGRSGHLLTLLCKPDEQTKFQELLMLETSTLGARTYNASRLLANRQWRTVALEHGQTVRIKIALDENGALINAQPEFADCAEYATKYGVPLKQVLAEAIAKFQNS
jgi:uncharacterized protein (TIGR00299 family) protein